MNAPSGECDRPHGRGWCALWALAVFRRVLYGPGLPGLGVVRPVLPEAAS
ncbi:hypothetical protein BH20GEM3_BH20GEM3_05450 [soil metagenome]